VSPPPEKSKTDVLKCLSESSNIIPIINAGFAAIIILEATKRASTKKDLNSLLFLKAGAPKHL